MRLSPESRYGAILSLLLVFFLAMTTEVAAGTLARFSTIHGEIEVELFDQDKPVTVRNFVRYVQSGAYSNMLFHRCLPGFVIQGGGFAVTNPSGTNDATSFLSVTNYGTITNEFNVGPMVSNTYGTIAMAKLSGDPDSASSQWFINLADNSADLDDQNGGFTVFGRVVRGTNALNAINTLSRSNGIVDLRWWFGEQAAVFSDLPVLYNGLAYPRYADLTYAGVSLLQVEVRVQAGGAREISWNTVGNATNAVEFASGFPPVWETLVSTNGAGGVMSVTDSSPDAARLYRVRVDF